MILASDRRRRRLIGVGLLAVFAAAFAIASARQGENSQPTLRRAMLPCLHGRIGIATHFNRESPSTVPEDFARIRKTGITWVREDFVWATVQPTPGAFHWAETDAVMAGAARAGVNVLAILDYSAPWASSDPSGGGDQFYPPRHPSQFAEYARQVVLRYGTDGVFWQRHPGLDPRPLTAVEIWNEPYGHWFWKPAPDPAAYARLAHVTAVAVRNAKPDTTILLPVDVDDWSPGRTHSWMSRVLGTDPELRKLIDGYGVHPFPSPRQLAPRDRGPVPRRSFPRVALVHRIALAHHAAHPIWITEIGWSTARRSAGGVSEGRQLKYIKAALRQAFTNWPYVKKFFVYSWDKSHGGRSNWDGNLGLRDADGSPKPALTGLEAFLARNARRCGASDQG